MKKTVVMLKPFGAEVSGVQIGNPDALQPASVLALLAEHRVVVFRGQSGGDHELVAFLQSLGPLMFTAGETPVAGSPDLNVVSNMGRKTRPRSVFHTDTSYVDRPPAIGALRAVVLPSNGGETLFSDQLATAAGLPDRIIAWLAARTVIHATVAPDGTIEQVAHPLLQRHPVTGETTLFLSTPERCSGLSGTDADTSRRILSVLYRRSTRTRCLYRHEWRQGDVVLWDNRATMHRADHTNVSGDRVLHRGLVRGDIPRGA